MYTAVFQMEYIFYRTYKKVNRSLAPEDNIYHIYFLTEQMILFLVRLSRILILNSRIRYLIPRTLQLLILVSKSVIEQPEPTHF